MSKNISDIIQEIFTANNPRKESDSINYFFDEVFLWIKAEVITLIHNPYTHMTIQEKREVLFSLDRSLSNLHISIDYYKYHLKMLWIKFEQTLKINPYLYIEDISV